MSFVAYR